MIDQLRAGRHQSADVRRFEHPVDRQLGVPRLVDFDRIESKADQTIRRRERFRPTPGYDFSRPPHPGLLWYERLGWPLDGARWRRAVAAC